MMGTRKRRGSEDFDQENIVTVKKASPMQLRSRLALAVRNGNSNVVRVLPIEEKPESFDLMALPNVVKTHLLSVASLEQLGLLAISSHACQQLVAKFVLTKKFQEAFMKNLHQRVLRLSCCTRCCSNHINLAKQMLQKLAVLLKRLTIIIPTKQRLQLLERVVIVMNSGNITMTPILASSWGRVFHVFMKGWEEDELKYGLSALWKFCKLSTLTSEAFRNQPGSDVVVEWEVRLLFRRLMFDEEIVRVNNNHFAFWLAAILQPLVIVNQAKLLYIVYGPTKQIGNVHRHFDQFIINWSVPNTRVTFTLRHAQATYGDMACALSIMFAQSDRVQLRIHDFNVLSVMEEITNLPEPWMLDNLGCLLLLVSTPLAVAYLQVRMASNRVTEVGWMVYYMFFVAHRLRMPYPMEVLTELYISAKPRQKPQVIDCIIAAHDEIVTDLIQQGAAPNNEDLMNEIAFWSEASRRIVGLLPPIRATRGQAARLRNEE